MKVKLIIDGKEYTADMDDDTVKGIVGKEAYWEPDIGEIYFAPSDLAIEWENENQPFDICMIKQWLAFRTKEECEEWMDKQRAITRIKKFCVNTFGKYEPDWKNDREDKYTIFYDTKHNGFLVTSAIFSIDAKIIPYLRTEEDVLTLIKEMESDLKIVFGIK